MKSIRAKLFLSMGLLITLLFVSNYFLAKFFVVRDSNATAKILLKKSKSVQERLHHLIAVWVSHYFVHNATQLETFAQIVEASAPTSTKESLLAMSAQLFVHNPALAYIQLEGASGQKIAIAPEDATLYAPLWAPLEGGKKALYFPNHTPAYYVATPLSSARNIYYYTLEEKEELKKMPLSAFRKFEEQILPADTEAPAAFYQFLTAQEKQLMMKAEMIKAFIASKEPRVAIFSMNEKENQGYALFANELFSVPIDMSAHELQTRWSTLSLLIRKDGKEPKLDLATSLQVEGIKMFLAFSFSSMANEISRTLGRPMLLSDGNVLTLLYQYGRPPTPIVLPLGDSKEDFVWEGVEYKPYVISLQDLTVTLLTPTAEIDAIPSLMQTLGEKLEKRISLNLLMSAVIGLAIALVLLSRLSKRVTQPIVQLAHVAEEIGRGKYEGVVFPDTSGRKDEIAIFSHSFKNMVAALADREKMHGVLNKVVSAEIATEILQGSVELGGEERVVTLLFSDIRNFTHLSNSLHPKEVIEMLNDYMTTMCHEIDKTQGVVDKFVGDEIIALYGAPIAVEQHAEKAVQAAIAMMRVLCSWNQKRLELGKKPLEIGIGLHTGIVCSGNMGSENRLNYTVIGANVNLASRLCAAARPMHILLTAETKAALVGNYTITAIEPLVLKGFDKPVQVFSLDWQT